MARRRQAVRNPDLVIFLANLAETPNQPINEAVDAASLHFGPEATLAAADKAGEIVTAKANYGMAKANRAAKIYYRARRNCSVYGGAKSNPYARENFWGKKETVPALDFATAFGWVESQRVPRLDRGVTKYLIHAPSVPGLFGGNKPVWYFLEYPTAREAQRASETSWPITLIKAKSPWQDVQASMRGFRNPDTVHVYVLDSYKNSVEGPLNYNDVQLLASGR